MPFSLLVLRIIPVPCREDFADRINPHVTAPFRFPRFFVTNAGSCPYLPGKAERKVFTELTGAHATELMTH
jgi:hypothetical protein